MQISSFVAFAIFLAFSQGVKAQPAGEILQKMSIEEKVGQTMIWTYGGKEFSSVTREVLEKYKLGALIAFSRNIRSISQISRFNSQAQDFARKKLKAPLFLMVDQEGGIVTRVKVSTPLPSALALGQMDDPDFIESYSQTGNELLSALGFSVNLAPVMDMSDASRDSFMSNRVFGNDPERVAKLAMAYARGAVAAGIIPTAKHFPGHGGMVEDSHQSIPKKLATLEELEKRDLVPFKEFISADMPKALMMAHMALPNIDPSGVPATYSHVIIQDHLRKRLGYTGLLLTDDLEMGGASISEDIGERAIRAFLAGNDMLMLAGHPRSQRKAYLALVAAVRSGRISKARLDESVRRILDLKMQNKFLPVKPDGTSTRLIKTKLESLSKEIMTRNFKKTLDSKSSQWPAIESNTQAIVFASDPAFFRNFRKSFAGKAKFVRLTPRNLDQVKKEMADDPNRLAIFYASGTGTARWINKMPDTLKGRAIIVNCNNPGKIESQERFMGVLNINSYSPESGEWLALALNTKPELRAPAANTPALPQAVPQPVLPAIIDQEFDQ